TTAFAYLSPVVFTNYPPMGLAAHSFLTLAAYMFSIGFYYSAASISESTKLRAAIRKHVLAESKLLDGIGIADLTRRLEKTVVAVARANSQEIEERTGVVQPMSEEEVLNYMNQVISDMRKQKGISQ